MPFIPSMEAEAALANVYFLTHGNVLNSGTQQTSNQFGKLKKLWWFVKSDFTIFSLGVPIM